MEHQSLPVIPSGRSDDLHHLDIADSADLVLFMAGNQFMAMAEIVSAFRKKHPGVEKIYYQTLPPGLELKQILAGGARFGGSVLSVRPDIYTSVSLEGMRTLARFGAIDKGAYRLYLHNRLTLMVPAGNPGGISAVTDLGRDAVCVSQPDPANEDIGFHILDMYRKAGGESLVRRIMEDKRAEGTTIYTRVHHRETPLRILKRTVDVGPVWATEVIHAQTSGLAVDAVEPGESLDQRERINYYVCMLQNPPHPENAARFLDFITSETCGRIYAKYGFVAESPAV